MLDEFIRNNERRNGILRDDEAERILDVEVIKGAIYQELLKIDTGAYDDFKMDEDGFITEYRNTQAPSYIFNDGIEPITFFEFKKNGTLREMQIPNIKYYCSFIYNTMAVYEDLFMKLYGEPENQQYVSNSNSYIMFNELFHVYRLYDGDEEIIDSGVFAVRNNKLTGQLALEENNVRYLSMIGFSLNSIASLRKESATKWSKYKLTTPVKRSAIVQSYFLSLLLWLIVGMVFAGIGVALSIMLHGFPFDKDTDVFMLFVIGVGISLFMGAIFFPLFYVGGEERNEVFLVISLLCGIGFVMGLTTLINTLFPAPMTTMQIILGGVIIFACALLVFVISCPVTAYVYHKREY